MVKLLVREAAIVLLTGLFALFVVPALLGDQVAPVLFGIGVMMALTYAAVYAMGLLGAGRLKPALRGWIGIFAWLLAFESDLVLLGRVALSGARPSGGALYTLLAPALYALVLVALAVWKRGSEEPTVAAGWALYAYALPMLMVRWLLLPLVGQNSALADLALQCGAFYLALRVLLRILWPFRVEGNESAPPLIFRPIPDQIVGLVEGTTRRRARPFATAASGARDDRAISVLCAPAEADEIAEQLTRTLAGKPFDVAVGARVEGQAEVVIRPRA